MSFGSVLTTEQLQELQKRTMTLEDLAPKYIETPATFEEAGRMRWCLHELCSDCKGTGVKASGGICIHGLSCPCSRCSLHS